ncbi:hypothetical protein J5N97_016917 [Dioscorea zingiberensis]|uniref:Uncharacterized protein n=1 Tax=Dioscorea zingiberensis TaxID=325984 RepID=A0A9D5CM63_9LILI|nr:hypothetical protein J5N97_016917 [Dioscorea zingiberensis]
MACINMYSSGQEHHQGAIPMSPRISFSNDFVVEQAGISSVPKHSASPGDPDFEFSIGSRPMMAADELFFKGRLVPLRESCTIPRPTTTTTTLREELLAGDEDDAGAWSSSTRPAKSIKWKEFLGLKKPVGHCGNKKLEKSEGGVLASVEEDGGKSTLQEMRSDGGGL